MTAKSIANALTPEVIEQLMHYGRQIDKELERIVGQRVIYAMGIAINMPGGLIMHRLANTDVKHAGQLFTLAADTPLYEQHVQKLHEH